MPVDGPGIVQFTDAESLCRMSKSEGPSSCDAGPTRRALRGVMVLEKSIALSDRVCGPNWTDPRFLSARRCRRGKWLLSID